ncbi:hypothetical protein [Candidatus Aalborgicola defluviihabitans]|uniref:hypothetical protein n=1 Tax=Candidatus Aalborgicola defluviihabitans TaxID=3386187 RepID=UPI001ECD3245|nr:hypothetical protein [Burkholderiales bacterium]
MVGPEISRDHPGTYDSVVDGTTVIRSPTGELQVNAGQYVFAARDLALRLLAERPEFLAPRTLHLEERIQERKEMLSQRVRDVMRNLPDAIRTFREKADDLDDEQRQALRKRLKRRDQKRQDN